MLAYIFFLIGLAAILAGAQLLVVGASRFAATFGVPPIVIGLTIVGFGTSAPEIVISGLASFQGDPDTALGNVVGSNIANVGLVLGVAACIYPLVPDRTVLRREGPVMVAVSLAFLALGFTGEYERWHGAIMLAALAVFLLVSLRWTRDEPEFAAEMEDLEHQTGLIRPSSVLKDIVYVLIGIAFLFAGGQALISGATDIAADIGIPEFVVASTLVAIGTSLPELATSITAALKKEADIAVGNVIGSNIFNLLGVLGIAAVIAPIPVEGVVQQVDLPAMVAFSLVAMAMARWGYHIARWEGAALLLVYVAYVGFLLAR